MKRILYPVFLGGMLCILASSCQKAYERPDITGTTTGAGGGGGTSTGSGSQLIKYTATEAGGSSEYKYEYNSSGQLTKVVLTGVAAGQTIIFQWRLIRDNAGKLTGFSHKVNIPDYPDSVLYTFHYPTGSANFDYATASYLFAGESTKDSLLYNITLGKITQTQVFQNYGNTGYMATSKNIYTYDANGNIKTVDGYEDLGSGLVRSQNFQYEYDDKSSPLQLGLEAFIFSPNYVSKNNYIKEIRTDYTTSTSGKQETINYAYQYNSLNKPVSAVVSITGSTGTAQLGFTYQ